MRTETLHPTIPTSHQTLSCDLQSHARYHPPHSRVCVSRFPTSPPSSSLAFFPTITYFISYRLLSLLLPSIQTSPHPTFSSYLMHLQLQNALDASNFTKVEQLVLSIPTSISPSSSSIDIARTLERIRRTIDLLIQALDFNLSFETSYHARNRLLSTQIPHWGVQIQRSFSFNAQLMARLAAFMQLLATSADGRNIVGRVEYVDDLAKNWKNNPHCVNTVNALATFCSGHIDNVSRCMRRGAITTALSVLENSELLSVNPALVNETVVLLGLCAICTPDNKREAQIVVPTLTVLLQTPDLNVNLIASLLTTLANIFDCWTKEHTGYEVSHPHDIVRLAVQHWTAHADHQEITSAAAWLLLSMLGTPRFCDSVAEFARDIQGLSKPWAQQLKTVQQLHQVASNFVSGVPKQPTASMSKEAAHRKVYGTRHAAKKRRIACTSAPNSLLAEITVVHGSESETDSEDDVPIRRLRRRRTSPPPDDQEVRKVPQKRAAKKHRNECKYRPNIVEEEITVVHGSDSESELDLEGDVPLCSMRRSTPPPSQDLQIQKIVRRKRAQRRVSAPLEIIKTDISTDTESIDALPAEEEVSPRKKKLPVRKRRLSERAARSRTSNQWWVTSDPLANASIISDT